MTPSLNKFVLSNLPIIINLSKCEKALYFLCKDKKVSHGSFYTDKWFLDCLYLLHSIWVWFC